MKGATAPPRQRCHLGRKIECSDRRFGPRRNSALVAGAPFVRRGSWFVTIFCEHLKYEAVRVCAVGQVNSLSEEV